MSFTNVWNKTAKNEIMKRRWTQSSAQEANKLEMKTLMAMVDGQKVKEAVAAFMEKRLPDFSRFK